MFQIYSLHGSLTDLIIKVKGDFPDIDIHIDKELAFYDYLIPGLESKEEILTIRFKQGMIRVPNVDNGSIPWVAINPDKSRQQIGYADLGMLVVAHVKDFPLRLVRLDEYKTKEGMIYDISKIYGHALQPNDILSGYVIAELHKDS